MIRLTKGVNASIEARPRWPDKHISIDNTALDALYKVQALLPSPAQLVITRAYQPEGTIRKLSRAVGKLLFAKLYPARRTEVDAIFGHNGHASDGTHIDIAINYKGKSLHFLPLGVFTPLSTIRRKEQQYFRVIKLVKEELVRAGFHIHPNLTEALQIHCDFIGTQPHV